MFFSVVMWTNFFLVIIWWENQVNRTVSSDASNKWKNFSENGKRGILSFPPIEIFHTQVNVCAKNGPLSHFDIFFIVQLKFDPASFCHT